MELSFPIPHELLKPSDLIGLGVGSPEYVEGEVAWYRPPLKGEFYIQGNGKICRAHEDLKEPCRIVRLVKVLTCKAGMRYSLTYTAISVLENQEGLLEKLGCKKYSEVEFETTGEVRRANNGEFFVNEEIVHYAHASTMSKYRI